MCCLLSTRQCSKQHRACQQLHPNARCASLLNSCHIASNVISLYRAPDGAGNNTEHISNFTRLVRGQVHRPFEKLSCCLEYSLPVLDVTSLVQGARRCRKQHRARWQLHPAGERPSSSARGIPQCAAHAPLAGVLGLHLRRQGLGGELGCHPVLCC